MPTVTADSNSKSGDQWAGSSWVGTLKSNLLIPIVLLLVIPAGRFVENPDRLDPYFARILMLIGINITLAVSLQLINGISGQFSLGHAGFMALGAYLAGYPSATYSEDLTHPGAVLVFYVAMGLVVGIIAGVLYGLFVLIRLSRRVHPVLPLVLVLLLLAWFVIDIATWSSRGEHAYLIWSKLIEAAQSTFTAIIDHGAKPGAWMTAHLPESARRAITFLILLIGGASVAAGAGLLVGLPTLRLRGIILPSRRWGLRRLFAS